MHRPWTAQHDDAATGGSVGAEVSGDLRESALEIVAVAAARTQPAHRVTALVRDTSHQRGDVFERAARRRFLWHAIDREVQLHRGAQHALQQRIVQFLREAGAFGETLFEAAVEAPRDLPQTET